MGFVRLFKRSGPKIKVKSSKKDGFSGWIKCSSCSELIHAQELSEKSHQCPKCNYHYRISVQERLDLLLDKNSFIELFDQFSSVDPLEFSDKKPYKERLKEAQAKTQRKEAIVVGTGKVFDQPLAIAVLDFAFMGGSMGSVVGEKLTCLIEYATDKKFPLLIVSASGGARMQESILSLMQMAKTSSALAKHHEDGLLYISLLTNPTMGGVTASFASLGDIILAEPGALIGFAGPRVIEQTIKQKLPKDAQKSEFLQEKGMVDLVVPRDKIKKTISSFLQFFTRQRVQKSNFLEKKPLVSLTP